MGILKSSNNKLIGQIVAPDSCKIDSYRKVYWIFSRASSPLWLISIYWS